MIDRYRYAELQLILITRRTTEQCTLTDSVTIT